MSYTNIISNTKTQAHSIVPEGKDQTVLERITNAQGTGITGNTIRRVAQFIGMEGLPAPVKAEVTRGVLSVDFEIERQQWRSGFKNTATLEETERTRRQTDSGEAAKKSRAFVFSKSILQSIQSPRTSSNYDRPVSRKFLNYIRKNLTAIEEIERQRRKEDSIGENAKRSLARLTSATIFSGLQSPSLISTGHLVNVHRYDTLSTTLGKAGEAAFKKIAPVAESFAANAYQIGNFAARAAYFFGGKAAVKAQDLGQKAAVQGQILGVEAAVKGQQIGQQALVTGQALGYQAIEQGQILGHKAVEEAQYLGTKAVSGAQALGQKAQVLASQAAHSTAAGAQNLATGAQNLAVGAQNAASNAVTGAQNAASNAVAGAQNAASNAVAGVQHLGEQAVEKAQAVKDNVTAAVADVMTPSLSWKQLAKLERAERRSRTSDQFNSNRFALALQTSALIKDVIRAQDVHYSPESEPRKYYGSFILEETERMNRIAFDKTYPYAKENARHTADIIRAYRQQSLSQAQRQATSGYTAPAQALVKEAQAQQVSPVRYQAAM